MITKAYHSFGARLTLILIFLIGMLGISPAEIVLANTIVVTNTSDSGSGSLRQAIVDAVSGDIITFDSSLGSSSIIDLYSPLLIHKDLTIDGSNLANPLSLKFWGGNVQIQSSTVAILNLIIQRGYNNGNGGAIWSNGNLTLFKTTIKDSYATGNGGAIYTSGTLMVQSSAIYNNEAELDGGGIYSETSGDQVKIANSTIAENYAHQDGGGIYTTGNTVLSVVNSTLAQNAAGKISQIMSQGQSQVTFSNSIAACWFPRTLTDCYYFIQPPSQTNSILGVQGENFGLIDLADNGGPTKTMSIAINSPLVDAGNDVICAGSLVSNWDQRSIPRPQGSHCDIGAYELIYHTISGNAGIGGAVIKNGDVLFTVADASGNYSFKAVPGWSGTAIPSKWGYSFTPAKKVYTNVQTNKTGQNYSATANTFVDPHNPRETWRVSVASDGGQADDWSMSPSISADGRHVAYSSQASNIVPGDFTQDIFVYDNQTRQTIVASVDSDGTPFNCNSYSPSISADGRYVAFSSCYQGAGLYWIVYVYDRHTGILESVNRGLTPSISGDGRYVAYLSEDNDQNQFRIFVRDRLTEADTQVSISSTGGQPNGDSLLPSLSSDGRYVAFYSVASNLVSNDTNGVGDVFVYDLQTNQMTRVSIRSNGAQANGESFTGSISADGRYVAFASEASNLVSNDTNGLEDVFVHDRQTGQTIRVSVSTNGTQGNGESNLSRISADGRYITFRSLATNLISGDTNSVSDIYMYDRQTVQTRRVSVGSNGSEANGDSPALGAGFSISADGKYLAFSSDATNLVQGGNDTNGVTDIFVHETTCSCINISIHGAPKGGYEVPLHSSLRQSFAGVDNGPVKIEGVNVPSLFAAERVIYKAAGGAPVSFSEMMGLPTNQLDTLYWLPWYNNKTLNTQLRIANPSDSQQALVDITIGGTPVPGSPFTIDAGQSIRKTFTGIDKGPVKIESTIPVVAAERVIYKVNGADTSFSEMMAMPDGQLDTLYWLPWYNNKTLNTQLRIANPSDTQQASVDVSIGGTPVPGNPFTIDAGQSIRKTFTGIDKGPVKIESNIPVVAAERVIYKAAGGVDTSFSEMMAMPNNQLDILYWLPWYNNKTLNTQLRIANPSDTEQALVNVSIGGVPVPGSPFTLLPGTSIRKTFTGIDKGPVKIESNIPIVAAERVIYKAAGGVDTSFSEMMALPSSLLDVIYWFPWYNNVTLDTQLRFGVP